MTTKTAASGLLTILSLIVAARADAQISVAGSGLDATISDDGRYVAFQAQAFSADTMTEIFVRDRQAATTTKVSVTSAGETRPGSSIQPRISADGRYVAFISTAALVDADTNNTQDVYVHDRATHETTLVSAATDGTLANAGSTDVSINGDGRWVAFSSIATNLVPGDTNNASDVFLRDRTTNTTTRVSVSTGGLQGDAISDHPAISDDGSTIAFLSSASTLAPLAPNQCGPETRCVEVFVHTRDSGVTERVVVADALGLLPSVFGLRRTWDVAISRDGRTVALLAEVFPGSYNAANAHHAYFVHDRVAHRTFASALVIHTQDPAPALALSADGRHLAISGQEVLIVDLLSGEQERVPDVLFGPEAPSNRPDLSADGRFVLFDSTDPFIVEPDSFDANVFVVDRDADGDGMLNQWESRFRLQPFDPTDAALDPDEDGRTNLQEYRAGTHPKGTFVRYFAEGASNAFFDTRLTLFNPTAPAIGGTAGYATYVLRFLGSNGLTRSESGLLFPHNSTRLNLRMDYVSVTSLPDSDFSTIIESDVPLVAEREMTWDGSIGGPGSSAETALVAPRTTWYLAEGATHGAFDLFYLLQNPNDEDAHVTVTFLRPSPLAPIVKEYVAGGSSRLTLWVDTLGPELDATDVSAIITSDRPILVERSMYYSTPGHPFLAGHAGAGIPQPATSWFLAEGATGPFFDEYVLIANPSVSPASIAATYLLPGGDTLTKTYDVAGRSRLTISVADEDARLASTAVSVRIESATPVVVERAMWWPKGNWYESHLSAGATTTGTTWAIADGEVEPFTGRETYVLIANTSDTSGIARITLFVHTGDSVTEQVVIPAHGRVTVPIGGFIPSIAGQRFSVIVESDGPPIVVERATYANDGSVVWSSGSAALATKLQ
jgi:hypothetical protein